MSDSTSKSGDPVVPENLFKDVKYYLIGDIDEQIQKLLQAGGAKKDTYLSQMITHAIADNADEDDYSEAKEIFEIPVVTSRWVILSVRCGALLPTNAFRPEKEQLFSDIVACPSQLSQEDTKAIWGLVSFHGGTMQMALNKKVTHLVCTKPVGAKYECAIEKKEKIKIVTPDWFVECVAKKSKVEEERYHPRLLDIPENRPKTPTPPPPPEPSTPPPDPNAGSSMNGLGDSPKSQRAKEALARMVNHRMQASGRVLDFPEFPPAPGLPNMPGLPPGPIPHMMRPQGPGSRPASPRTMSPRAMSPRATLRNITNSSDSKPPAKSPNRRNKAKINQLVTNLNFPGAPPHPFGMMPGHSRMPHEPMFPNIHGAVPPFQRPPHGRFPPAEVCVYYGHDPMENVPSDMPFLGCVFHITDYQKYAAEDLVKTWRLVIEQHGGQVDDSYSNRITHLLCDKQESNVFQLAVRDQKRIVTAHWLNDTLCQKKMLPPWMALHFPSIYDADKPGAKQIISVSGFESSERAKVKYMISMIGAKYTSYLSHTNSVLVCKKPVGQKYEKALEWSIPVVNVQWLTDMLLGQYQQALKLPLHGKYHQFGHPEEFKIEPTRMAHLLEGWRTPLKISKEVFKKFEPSLLLKHKVQEEKRKRKAEEEMERANKRPRREIPPQLMQSNTQAPLVLLTGIAQKEADQLAEKIEEMGGYVTFSAMGGKVTHLVARSVGRTVKFLTALSVVKHICTPEWITDSHRERHFLDEGNYRLQDKKLEAEFSFSLAESLIAAQRKKVFQGLTFYITPGVAPGKKILKDIVQNAGGHVIDKRPSVRKIRGMRTSQGDYSLIIISCEGDVHLNKDLLAKRIPIHNAEFILTGVMRQKVDMKAYVLT